MKRFLAISLAVVLALGVTIVPLPAQPALAQTTIYVDASNVGAPLEDGSAAYPFDKIQEGIDAASSGDIVLVASGTYTGDGNRDLDFKGKAITVRSINGAEATIIDVEGTSEDKHRGFYFHSSDETSLSVVDGFTIKNGFGPVEPFSGSNFSVGGAIYITSGSSPTITNCIITGNIAKYGGGIQVWDNSSPTITYNVITGNTAIGGGGGICVYNLCHATITNNIITENDGGLSGGGIKIDMFSSAKIINNIIANNTAQGKGGGIDAGNSSPSIINNTVTRNSSQQEGGGMYFWHAWPVIVNTIVWGNTAEINGDEIWDAKNSFITVNYSDIGGGWVGEGNISADPIFVDPENRDYHLQSTSPCIDAGSNAVVPSWLNTDFEGDPRIWDGDGDGTATVDMGADEYYVAVDIKPDTLNLQDKGKWIACYIELPAGYKLDDIDVSTVKLNGVVSAELKPTQIGDYDGDGIPDLMVKFDRSAVQAILVVGDEVEITVTGEVAGTPFEGSDIIRVK